MSTPPGIEATVLEAWQALLAAEHEAVFVYRSCGPHLAPADHDLAYSLQAEHQTLRDQLTAAILAAGATPVTPAADYPVPRPLDARSATTGYITTEQDEARAARLLLLAAASSAASTTATASPAVDLLALRQSAQGILSASAVRALTWRRRVSGAAASVAFPGL